MPTFTLSRERAKELIAAVEEALAKGHPPPGVAIIGSHRKSAIRIAADEHGVVIETLRGQVGDPICGGSIERVYGLKVDWSKYQPQPPPQPDPVASEMVEETPPAAPEIPADPIELRRLRDEVTGLRAALKQAERRAADAEDIRSGVLGLVRDPLVPQLVIPPLTTSVLDGRTVILHLSDIHYGEVVSAEEMDGLNRYDEVIAQKRLGRFFAIAADLMTEHWKGAPPDEIVLCLGGDLISGNLHAELEITNAPAVPHQVREVGRHVAGGIILLHNEVKRPIRVYSVPGNHGRTTDKPRSKGRSASSLDLLATDFCEATVRGNAAAEFVTFYKAHSPDLYFSTYGFHWLLTHGDAMGFRGGGTGFIGPLATIIKGHRKLVDTSWRSGKPVHRVITGHFHTTGKTTFGYANGAVIGYGEYARDLRADPEVAQQNMLVVHPRHGVIEEHPLYLGDADEGSLYGGPASLVRPQWGDA